MQTKNLMIIWTISLMTLVPMISIASGGEGGELTPSVWCIDSEVSNGGKDHGKKDGFVVYKASDGSDEVKLLDECFKDEKSGVPLLKEWYCVDGVKTMWEEFDCSTIGKECCYTFCCNDMDDLDGDTVLDKIDNCPGVVNPPTDKSEYGYPIQSDKDEDGLGDACDNCVYNANPDQAMNSESQIDASGKPVGDACFCNVFDKEGYLYTKGPLDYCHSTEQNILMEVICHNDMPGGKYYKHIEEAYCPNGCQNGACITGGDDDPNSPANKDSDGDGEPDNEDNCIYKFNPLQKDLDGDGIGDLCDDDKDGDGVLNNEDNCPEVFNPGQENTGGDPELGDACDMPNDIDEDGVPNEDDNCINTPNPDQADLNSNGIGDVCEDIDTGDPEGDSDGDGGDCEEIKNKSVEKNSLTTADFYVAAGADYNGQFMQWIGGEGGNIVERKDDGIWKKYESVWDAAPNMNLLSTVSDEGRGITALCSPDGKELLVGTYSGYLFLCSNDSCQQWGPSGLSDYKSFGAPIFAISCVMEKNNDGKILSEDYWLGGENLIRHYYWEKGDGDKNKAFWVNISPTIIQEENIEANIKRFRARAKRDEIDVTETSDVIKLKPQYKILTKFVVRDIAPLSGGGHWLVGDNGLVLKKEDDHYKEIDFDSGIDLRAIEISGGKIYVGGNGGKIWVSHSGGNFVPSWEGAEGVTIMGISGDAGNLFAVGSGSTLLEKTGSGWSPIQLPFPNSLTGVISVLSSWIRTGSQIRGGRQPDGLPILAG